jgi:hypothetical protein
MCLLPVGSHAKRKSKTRRPPPKFVLVELFSETSRMKALEKAGRYRDIEVLKKDMRAVQAATIKDFSDNFDFCPVYYFIDNDFQAIMDQQFEGVLLDSALQAVPNVSVTDTNYLIVYYGRPTWQTHERRMEVTSQTNVGSSPNGRGLIYNNYKMRQVGYSYVTNRFLDFLIARRRSGPRYESRKFDIEYRALASEFNDRLKEMKRSFQEKETPEAEKSKK